MSETENELLAIYHPFFRRGYQDGRRMRFREKVILTDKQLVEFILQLANDRKKINDEVYVQYMVGHLVGQMSGGVIPRQPADDDTQEVQEAFLLKVAAEYGETGADLVEQIRQHWARQDELAERLDGSTFAQMLKRGEKMRGLTRL
jgi:hypothetical protein